MAKQKPTLDAKTIGQITDKLSHFLSDTILLYIKTLNFHWNMVGPEFFMYHRLLEEQYKELVEGADEIAERIRQLGKHAPGSMHEFLKLACLKEAKSSLGWREMISNLVQDHDSMVEHCHKIIEFTDNVLDQGTSDLFNELIRAHSKSAWLLRSHLVKH